MCVVLVSLVRDLYLSVRSPLSPYVFPCALCARLVPPFAICLARFAPVGAPRLPMCYVMSALHGDGVAVHIGGVVLLVIFGAGAVCLFRLSGAESESQVGSAETHDEDTTATDKFNKWPNNFQDSFSVN